MSHIDYTKYREDYLTTLIKKEISKDKKFLDSDMFFRLNTNKQLDIIKYLTAVDNINFTSLLENFNLETDDHILLKIASVNNAYRILQYFIQNGMDITVCDNFAIKAVISNSQMNNHKYTEEIIVMLIENGADIHVNDDLTLQLSIQYQQLEHVKILVQYGANIHNNNLLEIACVCSSSNILKYLIDCGMTIDTYVTNDIIIAIISSQYDAGIETIKILLTNGVNGSNSDIFHPDVLIRAIKSGSFELVKLLTDCGADFSVVNNTKIDNCNPLINKMMAYLLTNGVDPVQLAVIAFTACDYELV